ncbi:MAG: hypothetical protein AB7Q37_06155 [Pyrinomonadaceae bacterium]
MTANVEKLIDYLTAVRSRPRMYLGSDDNPDVADAYLGGTRVLALLFFDFHGSVTALQDEVATRRGYWYHADGIIAALRRKKLSDKDIVHELIESEIEFWKVYAEQMEK